MRRVILLILFLNCVIIDITAQNAFLKRDLCINGGVALMQYRNPKYALSENAGKSVPFYLSAEYGITPYISIGPFVGYNSRQFRYTGSFASDSMNNDLFKARFYTTGIRGSFHFTTLLEDKFNVELNSEDLDFYTSVLIGYQFNRFRNPQQLKLEENSKPVIGAVVGARYFINGRFAFFGEVGPGVFGLASLGVTARF